MRRRTSQPLLALITGVTFAAQTVNRFVKRPFAGDVRLRGQATSLVEGALELVHAKC